MNDPFINFGNLLLFQTYGLVPAFFYFLENGNFKRIKMILIIIYVLLTINVIWYLYGKQIWVFLLVFGNIFMMIYFKRKLQKEQKNGLEPRIPFFGLGYKEYLKNYLFWFSTLLFFVIPTIRNTINGNVDFSKIYNILSIYSLSLTYLIFIVYLFLFVSCLNSYIKTKTK